MAQAGKGTPPASQRILSVAILQTCFAGRGNMAIVIKKDGVPIPFDSVDISIDLQSAVVPSLDALALSNGGRYPSAAALVVGRLSDSGATHCVHSGRPIRRPSRLP